MIVFDLDGTVLDTLPDLTDATNAVLTAKGFAARETDEVRRFVGNGYHRLMEQAAPIGTTPAIIDELTQAFTKYSQVSFRLSLRSQTHHFYRNGSD